jgi:hypothetical protein
MSQEIAVAQQSVELEETRFMPVMSIGVAIQRRNTIVEAVQKLMRDGQDYGKIPGTNKPTLLNPGADKLNNLFGLVAKFFITHKEEDWTGEKHGGEAFFSYTVTCQLHRGDFLMGEGAGSCNSWESKYRYRKSERVCPSCGKDSIIKGKPEYGGGWLCYQKKGGCGAKFKAGDAAIEAQLTGRVANPDIFDQVNTILKMANKRAKIAATLNATSAHEFFTQDMEGIQREPEYEQEPPPPTPPPAPTVQTVPVASEVQRMWDHMTSIATVCEVFAQLKKRMVEVMGPAGESEYYRILKDQGKVSHANELKQRAARAVSLRMWDSIKQAEALGISDDDVPSEVIA